MTGQATPTTAAPSDTNQPEGPPRRLAVADLQPLTNGLGTPGRDSFGRAYLDRPNGRLQLHKKGARAAIRDRLAILARSEHGDRPVSKAALDQVAGQVLAGCEATPKDGAGDTMHVGQEGVTITVVSDPDAVRQLRAGILSGIIPDTYVRAGRIVVVEDVSGIGDVDPEQSRPVPVQATILTPAHTAQLLAHHVTVERAREDAATEWRPPDGVLSSALAGSSHQGMRPLVGIVGTPVIRPDGTLLQLRGYDQQTGLYLAPTFDIGHVPDRPTAAAVSAARAWLLDRVLCDFPWELDADRANYLAMLFTPPLRRYLRCLVPLGVIDASAPSSGKTLLASIPGLLAGQKTLQWPGDETELAKVITASFTETYGVVVWDNVPEGEVINSATLAGLLTREEWSGRVLGSSRTVSFVNDRFWILTGNNLRTGGDITSRAIRSRLNPKDPDPEERSGFVLGDMDSLLKDGRFLPKVMRAVLTLILDWTGAGAPRAESQRMRQFSGWTQAMGGLLAHHGIDGFRDDGDRAREDDADDAKWCAFLQQWLEVLGPELRLATEIFTSAEIVRDDRGQQQDAWRGNFITDDAGNRPRSVSQLGKLLTGHIDRWHGKQWRVAKKSNNSGTKYRVETVSHSVTP
jgi:hypothetical protein